MGWQAGELYESSTTVYVRLGMKFWVYHGRRGGRRRQRASRRGPGTGRAGGLFAADGGVDQAGTVHERWTRVHESSREIGQEFSAPHGKRAAGGKCRQGVPSFLRPLQGVEDISTLPLCGRRRRAAGLFLGATKPK